MPSSGTRDTMLGPVPAAAEHAPEGEAGDVERALLRALAAGRLVDVRALLRRSEDERGGEDLVTLLARTDARARAMAIDATEVQAVVGRIERELPPSSRLRFWAHAVLAERLLLDFDPAAFLVAHQALAALARCEVPLLPSLALRYARARLRRVESVTWFLVPRTVPGQVGRPRRDEAVAELLACGLVDEVHITRGLMAGVAALLCDEDIVENYTLLRDARAALGDDVESIWPSCLDLFIAHVAFEVGELDVSMEAADRIERAPHRHPRLDVVTAYCRAFFRLVASGASPQTVAGIEGALVEVRRHDPKVAQGWYGHAAETLADMASPWCAHFARLEAELPSLSPMTALRRHILALRVAAVGGEPTTAEEAIHLLERLEALGRRRTAARQALRLAHDLARVGAPAAAHRVHAWGHDRIPAGAQATLWERWWSRPIGATSRVPTALGMVWPATTERGHLPAASVGPARARPRSRPRLELRVMVPTAELAVDGTTVVLGAAQAKLLLALALAHPTPLHVEQATDLLWPTDPLPTTRNRLTSLVHRLRRTLGDHGDAVVRTGDLLALDAQRWEVDLWRLPTSASPAASSRLVPPGDDRRRQLRALADVRGNLCDAQFPYEERFVDERHRLCGAWLRHARHAVHLGELQPAGLEGALTALGLQPGDLRP